MPQQLFEVPFLLSLGMLAAMFASVLIPMLILPRFIPKLTTDAHEKSRWLDGLRGIAAATVALNHAPLVIINLQLVPKIFIFTQQEFALFRFFGSIGVQIFFCITGMLFANKILFAEKIDWTTFFRKRMHRVVPAYFFACGLALAMASWYSWPITQSLNEITAALPQLLSFGLIPLPKINGFDFGRLLGVNWSLAIEWRFYAMLPIVFILIRDFRTIAVIAIASFAVFDSILTGASSWVFFVSGALCAPIMNRQFGTKFRILGHIGIFVVITIYALYWGEFPDYGPVRWVLMTALFSSIVIARPWILTSNPVVAMGSVSYSFYLLHCMTLFAVFEACRIYAFDITNIAVRPFTILAGGALALATVLSSVSYLFVERPFMQTSRKVLKPEEFKKVNLNPV